MLDSLKKIPSSFLKILCLGCLLALLAVPALAQEQTPKEPGTPQATTPSKKPAALPPKASPRPSYKEYKMDKSMPPTMGGTEYKMKSVDDTVGGQEIRNKKGPEDIK
jgi:hypothetical protein